jgi:hypothetical protein
VSFAAEIGSALIAEGIETPAEHETLRQLQVGYGQGYLLGRPAPFAANVQPGNHPPGDGNESTCLARLPSALRGSGARATGDVDSPSTLRHRPTRLAGRAVTLHQLSRAHPVTGVTGEPNLP